ncbi:transglycosylase SLT domain-containing protein [Hydrogenivirga sp.]
MNRVIFSKPSYNYRQLLKKDVKSVAKEFEALMIKQVLKEAFRPIMKGKSLYQRFYYDMFLEGVSEQLADAGGVGIAKFVIESYEKNQTGAGSREELRRTVEGILEEEGLPRWLAKLPEVESSYDPEAVSPKGAAGLWQLMPDTARSLGLRVDEKIDERLDPVKSTRAAARLLRTLYNKYRNWILVLAAYNWGEGNVDRVGGEKLLKDMSLLPEETRNYIERLSGMLKLSAGL